MPVTNSMIKNWRNEKMVEEDGAVWIQAKDIVPGDIILTVYRLEVLRVMIRHHVTTFCAIEDEETGVLLQQPTIISNHNPRHWLLVEY